MQCEDSTLKPQGGATEETVYAAIREIGRIFDVHTVAEKLVSDIRNDFAIAEQALQGSGHSLSAVWLDCVGRCCKDENGDPDPTQVFVGGGTGAPMPIMPIGGLSGAFFLGVGGPFPCSASSRSCSSASTWFSTLPSFHDWYM